MDKHQEKEFKEKLLEEKKNLEKELSEFATENPRVEGDWNAKFPSFGDHKSEQDENADEVEEYLTEISTEHTLEKRIQDINIALEKLENGTYGKCENCNKEISIERLKVNPEARICIDCAKKNI